MRERSRDAALGPVRQGGGNPDRRRAPKAWRQHVFAETEKPQRPAGGPLSRPAIEGFFAAEKKKASGASRPGAIYQSNSKLEQLLRVRLEELLLVQHRSSAG